MITTSTFFWAQMSPPPPPVTLSAHLFAASYLQCSSTASNPPDTVQASPLLTIHQTTGSEGTRQLQEGERGESRAPGQHSRVRGICIAECNDVMGAGAHAELFVSVPWLAWAMCCRLRTTHRDSISSKKLHEDLPVGQEVPACGHCMLPDITMWAGCYFSHLFAPRNASVTFKCRPSSHFLFTSMCISTQCV